MHHVVIALGSNSLPSVHIQWATQRLSALLAGVCCSRTLWTPDTRGTGLLYMNRLMTGRIHLSLPELTQALKHVEAETGRTPRQVTIDLDVLLYDTQRCHPGDWSRPYVQLLLPDILCACTEDFHKKSNSVLNIFLKNHVKWHQIGVT